jgi:hypothetical protein
MCLTMDFTDSCFGVVKSHSQEVMDLQPFHHILIPGNLSQKSNESCDFHIIFVWQLWFINMPGLSFGNILLSCLLHIGNMVPIQNQTLLHLHKF